MTFAICLFIILMQFVWKYVEDLVGKGLETHVLAELFTYAALTLVPMALPLAILLASLMAFGNLGERYELLAIKAAGISLLKAMRPLMILIMLISFGAFLFQDDIIPKVQVKFRTLMISIKQTSPELDIPENTFYSGIDNYNLFVKSKNKETGMLYDVIIYDVSKGFDNMLVIVCDSAKMKTAESKEYLMLNLYYGQQFSNFQQSGLGKTSNFRNNKFVPYGRQNFKEREFIIPFDTNFSRIDDSAYQGTQLSKNSSELRASIDSLSIVIDSLNIHDRKLILNNTYLSFRNNARKESAAKTGTDTIKSVTGKETVNVSLNFDSVMSSLTAQERMSVYNDAQMKAENNKNDYMFRSLPKIDAQKKLRQHDVELQRKFTLSFACLIFFFIGAPLGAIIRKGGLGMPVVISVILFIIYYIIDNVGYKMARDGVWQVWQGVWLSSFILFPLGVFITYKAINDSALFNPEAYGKYFRRIFFIQTASKLNDTERNLIVQRIPDISQIQLEENTIKGLEQTDSDDLRAIIQNDEEHDYNKNTQLAALSILKRRGADIDAIIDRQNYNYAKANLNLFAGSSKLSLIAYLLVIIFTIISAGFLSTLIYIAYGILFTRSIVYYFNFYGKVNKRAKIYHTVTALLLFSLYPFTYLFVRKRMEKHLDSIQIIPNKIKN